MRNECETTWEEFPLHHRVLHLYLVYLWLSLWHNSANSHCPSVRPLARSVVACQFKIASKSNSLYLLWLISWFGCWFRAPFDLESKSFRRWYWQPTSLSSPSFVIEIVHNWLTSRDKRLVNLSSDNLILFFRAPLLTVGGEKVTGLNFYAVFLYLQYRFGWNDTCCWERHCLELCQCSVGNTRLDSIGVWAVWCDAHWNRGSGWFPDPLTFM